MLDEFEDTDLAQCTETWTSPYEYNVFSVTNQPKEGEAVDEANQLKEEQKPEKLKEAAEKMQDSQKNPYYYLYHWCEGELLDIQAVLTAIQQRDRSVTLMKKNEKSKASVEKEIDAAKAGKKTMKTMFKKETNVEKMDQKAENTMQEIDNLDKLSKIQTIYIGEKVIPAFKARKSHVYANILQQFNVLMINNAK